MPDGVRETPYTNVSEINSFVYCKRAWWLETQRSAVSSLQRERETGTEYHRQIVVTPSGSSISRLAWLVLAIVLIAIIALMTLR